MLTVIQANILASGYRALREATSRPGPHRPGYETVERSSSDGLSVARIYTTNANGSQIRLVMSHEDSEGHFLDQEA